MNFLKKQNWMRTRIQQGMPIAEIWTEFWNNVVTGDIVANFLGIINAPIGAGGGIVGESGPGDFEQGSNQ